MKKLSLLALLFLLPATSLLAQWDDMYYVPKKKAAKPARIAEPVELETEEEGVPDYYIGQLRDEDEYNRRDRAHVYGLVTEDGDTTYVTAQQLLRADSLQRYDEPEPEEYICGTRLVRFHSGLYSPYYWDVMYDPWFYDPWYYDPWYYGHYGFYMGWHSPYYGYYGYYSPWYYGGWGFGWHSSYWHHGGGHSGYYATNPSRSHRTVFGGTGYGSRGTRSHFNTSRSYAGTRGGVTGTRNGANGGVRGGSVTGTRGGSTVGTREGQTTTSRGRFTLGSRSGQTVSRGSVQSNQPSRSNQQTVQQSTSVRSSGSYNSTPSYSGSSSMGSSRGGSFGGGFGGSMGGSGSRGGGGGRGR